MVFIIIPVFNRAYFTKRCLQTLFYQSFKDFKIIVIDHGSSDGTYEMLKHQFPEVIVVLGEESLWWTGATNLGVKSALTLSNSDEDLILTLNNDLEVEESYLNELLKVYEINKPCLVGSTSVDINNPDKITFIGGTWNKYTAKHVKHNLTKLPYREVLQNKNLVSADLLPGRGVLIPITAFKNLGLYDEVNFPHYNADDDFSLRCKKNGYKLLIAVKALVKSHVDANGASLIKEKSFLPALYTSLTSIKSPNRFETRFRWAKKNTPLPCLYFTFDMLRIITSSIIKHLRRT